MPAFPFAPRWIRILGVAAILVSLGTWLMDLMDWVYPCPFCRVQRTAIGLLGVAMLLPVVHHWATKWVCAVVASLGLVVAATQNFNHIKTLFAGTFELGASWYMHPFLLSGAALFILTGQIMLIVGAGRDPAGAQAEPA